MFPAFLMPMLIGAGLGAITSKKDPLKGALIGGALGGVGGQFVPGLLSAGGATAGIAPGATAASQGGMLAAQEAGLGMTGGLGWGGATTGIQGGMNGLLGAEAGASAGGLLDQGINTFDKLGKIAQPVGAAMDTAKSMQPDEQIPPPAPLSSRPLDLSGVLQYGQQMRDYDQAESERRKQLMAMYAQNIGRV